MSREQKGQIAVKQEAGLIQSEVTGKRHSACTVERKIGGITYVITTEQSPTATETWRERMTKIILEEARIEMKKLSDSSPHRL